MEETPDRLSYSGTLAALVQSDALVVFGSEEPAYTASKIYPYLLSGRPVLAVFHEKSPVVSLMRAVGGGVCVTFDEETTSSQLAGGDPRGMVPAAPARAARSPRPRWRSSPSRLPRRRGSLAPGFAAWWPASGPDRHDGRDQGVRRSPVTSRQSRSIASAFVAKSNFPMSADMACAEGGCSAACRMARASASTSPTG